MSGDQRGLPRGGRRARQSGIRDWCLGANLARMEARVFFEEFFARFKGIEPCADPVFIRSNSIHGFKDMPVLLSPA